MVAHAFSNTWSTPSTHTKKKWQDKSFAAVYVAASQLTDPLTNAHKFAREALIVGTLNPDASEKEKAMRAHLLYLKTATHFFPSLVTTWPGIALRGIAKILQLEPYIYFKGNAVEAGGKRDSISLLTWNLCCPSGGYAITDGGVLPWPARIPLLATALLEQNADVVCLLEIFDIQAAIQLIGNLKEKYAHFYFNIGPASIGFSSGLFVASKCALSNPLFIPFPKQNLHGRGKYCNKGTFCFDVDREGQESIRIFTTHLQHSEMPCIPLKEEVEARRGSVELILSHMQSFGERVCILTGDLNMEEEEYLASPWSIYFDRGKIESESWTWGGDQFCSQLQQKPISFPLTLDHTLMTKNNRAQLVTTYVETGFDGTSFNPQALSDHKGLLSIITFEE